MNKGYILNTFVHFMFFVEMHRQQNKKKIIIL